MPDPKPERQSTSAPTVHRRGGPWRSLSGKVLTLIILFIMLGEVLIYVPSIANFRVSWLKQRIEAAQIATLVLEATPDKMVSEELKLELLRNADAKVVTLQREDSRHLMLGETANITPERYFDLRERSMLMTVVDAFEVLLAGGNGRIIRVMDMAPHDGGNYIDIVIDETPLRAAMITYSVNILGLSIILSILVATLVYVTLNRLLLRPILRLTTSMERFSTNPEDAGSVIAPSGRGDEMGTAEKKLEEMQTELASLLQQKNHLAALGLAVSKISHDLRNMLSSMQLISDRLGAVQDPTVQRLAPKLVSSIDRAIDFCAHTLKYGRAREAPPKREVFELGPLVDEVLDTAAERTVHNVIWRSNVPDGVTIDADREHMFRVINNLCRNAVQAIEADTMERATPPAIQVNAWREGSVVTVEVRDNGPGVPPRARENLFQAFRGSVTPGGTGLGLAISSELVRAHGGEIRLIDSDAGATFWITIPDRVSDLTQRRAETVA